VQLLYSSANRDEEHFPQPTEYDPHWPNLNDHVAFGLGLHYCIGAYLARLERAWSWNCSPPGFPGLRLVPGQEITHFSNFSLRGLVRQRLEKFAADVPYRR
jgi:cytochrome P450